ncbi:MAG: hypothetical protein LUE14_07795 [Clostridiales bacterium]|nr:hypothetical protein [Clostridiales bacterium]
MRETFSPYCINTGRCSNAMLGHAPYCYRATAREDCVDGLRCRWIPSIHMPKSAARIWLKVTYVKSERLQDITEDQAAREGCADIEDFMSAWQDTVPKDKQDACNWDANPWVWAIGFERCGKTEGTV